MKINELTKRLSRVKGIGYIITALAAGVALLLLSPGASGKKMPPAADRNAAFVSETEQSLRELGKAVCGKSCRVRVRLSSGYSYSYACDQSVRTSYNPDGSVAEKETALTQKSVNVSGGTSLVAVRETPPVVAGVAVVCRGASAADARTLRTMISALFGIDESAVCVTN